MKNMRLSVSTQEIANSFKYYQTVKKTVLLWQNIQENRVKIPALIIEAGPGIDVKFLAVNKNMSFMTNLPLYVYGEHDSLVFKANIKSSQGSELTISTPRLVRLEELRKMKRFDVSSVKNCLVTMKRFNSVEVNEFIYKINDISDTGLAFLMREDSPLKQGDNIQITHIQTDQIFYNLNGRIVHITPIKNVSGVIDFPRAKVGINFDCPFRLKDLTIYKKFIKEMN